MKTKKKLFVLAALTVTMLTSSLSMTTYAGQARGCSSSHSASSLSVVSGTYLGSCNNCGSSVYVRKCLSCGYMATVCSSGHFQ